MKTEMKTKMSTFSLGKSGLQDAEPTQVLESDAKTKIDMLSDFVSQLLQRPRMPAIGTSLEGDVLALDANLRPQWGGSSIDDGDTNFDILVWDTSVVDGSVVGWKVIKADADGKVLYRKPSATSVAFDYLAWR